MDARKTRILVLYGPAPAILPPGNLLFCLLVERWERNKYVQEGQPNLFLTYCQILRDFRAGARVLWGL